MNLFNFVAKGASKSSAGLKRVKFLILRACYEKFVLKQLNLF